MTANDPPALSLNAADGSFNQLKEEGTKLRQKTIDRFWSKVELSVDGCWIWTGAVSDGGSGRGGGYGRLTIDGVGHLAHRVAYEIAVGPIPHGLHVDHLCRVRTCVRPDHLEAVLPRENFLRGSAPNLVAFRQGTCRAGHPRTAKNTYVEPSGKRRCVTCEPHRKANAVGAVA